VRQVALSQAKSAKDSALARVEKVKSSQVADWIAMIGGVPHRVAAALRPHFFF
jgi:hypothetical protein